MRLILFDIDGTLVLSGGSGRRSLNRAFSDVCQVQAASDGVAMAGRTDRAIMADVLIRLGLTHDHELEERLERRYVECLADEIRHPHPAKRILPGVAALIEALSGREGVVLGLLTGNYHEAARIKLEHFALWHYFRFGAFGGDAIDRRDLLHIACRRAAAHDVVLDASQIVVVGDTPLDVECARAAGAVSVAVATGDFTEDSLRDAGASVVLRDLRDIGLFLRSIGLVGRSRGVAEPAKRHHSD